jgi:hypothetical protein
MEVVGAEVVLCLPRLHQHKEMVEEGGAGRHPHEHLAQVGEDGRLEDGVRGEVLKLEAELLQQQQEEMRDRQRQPVGEVGDEEHELPGGEIAEGSGTGVLHPSKLRTRLSAPSDWKRSGWTSEAMATTAVESRRARMQRGAEGSKVKGRNNWERMRKHNRCTWGESLFKEDSPARAPRRRRKSRPTRTKATQPMTRGPGPQVIQLVCGSPSAEKANRRARSEPLPTVVRLFISAKNNGPVSDTGARAHESYSLGVGSWVQKE